MAVPKQRRSKKKSHFFYNNWIQKSKKYIKLAYSKALSYKNTNKNFKNIKIKL